MTFPRTYLSEFVYGSTDGVITTFAIMAGVIGAGLSPSIVLILGISNVLADGFSMASSNYLSLKGTTSEKKPIKGSLVTFFSFVLLGTLPIIPFAVLLIDPEFEHAFGYSIVAAALAFVIIGGIKAHMIQKNIYHGAFESLLIGGVAATIAYSVGALLQSVV